MKEPRHLLRAATQPRLPACAGMRSWRTLQARLKEPGFPSDPGLPRDEELGNPQIGGMEPGPPQTPVKELRSLQSRGLSRGDGTGIPPQTWACPGVMQLGSPLRHRQSIRDPPPTWGRSRCDEPGPSSQGTRGCPGRSPAQRSPLPAGPATAVR